MDVLDPVPQRPAFARQRDSRRSKTNHDPSTPRSPGTHYYSGAPDINSFAAEAFETNFVAA